MALDLFTAISKDSSLEMRSKYLCLYLISLSFKPDHLSGKGLIALVKITISCKSKVSSPLRVLNKCPSTPTISPISINSKKSLFISDSSSL